MTTFEATPGAREGGKPAAGARIAPRSTVAGAAWLLRTAAITSVAAGILGVVIGPGVAGNASEEGVVASERTANAFGYFLMGLLLALVLQATIELFKSREAPRIARIGLVAGGTAVVLMSLPAMRDRVPPSWAVLMAALTAAVSLTGAYAAARTPHTRALAGVLCAFALGATARLAAWELAARAGDAASISLFGASRGLATASVFFDAAGQLIAVTWLGTRGKWAGQVASTAALAGALIITWSVGRGVHSGAAFWQAVLHSALADAPGVPPPYAFDALATFLVPASLLLGLVAALQARQVAALVAAMALALVSRGALDVPLCALCAVVAAQWATLASVDDRAMWRTLLDDRERHMKDGDVAPVSLGVHGPATRAADGEGPRGASGSTEAS